MDAVLRIENREFRAIALAFVGAGLITLCSFVRIPVYPVPFTMQTFAILILGLTQSPKQAFASALCYLCLASLGLPVLGGKVNPLWIAGATGGYLFAFPIGAFLISWLRQKVSPIPALLAGQAVILGFGWIWLAYFLGAEMAFIKGVLIFLPSVLFKAALALPIDLWKDR